MIYDALNTFWLACYSSMSQCLFVFPTKCVDNFLISAFYGPLLMLS